ncbi:MAG: EamA family transporter [Eubacteriales bacterium]|nr:EamA family transporter [Eubacteriales bacterium]MDD4541747.1 EamA family transporter [Eubacteriales bacterium]
MTKELQQKEKTIGISSALISALMFGISPAIAKLAYEGGSNGLTMTFTRSLMSLPFLFLIARFKNISLKLTKNELLVVVLVSIFGNFSTTLMLYSSFSYINVGMASVLHYFFPVIVTLVSVVFFKEKIKWWKLVALALGFAGVLTFMGTAAEGDLTGVLLAVGSSITYAAMLISVERTVLSTFHCVKLTFYTNLIVSLASFALGRASGILNLNLTLPAWIYSFVVSMMVGVIGFSLLNYAIVKIGASSTSVISMAEPLSGVLFAFLILGETLTLLNWLGCILIMTGVAIISIFTLRQENS